MCSRATQWFDAGGSAVSSIRWKFVVLERSVCSRSYSTASEDYNSSDIAVRMSVSNKTAVSWSDPWRRRDTISRGKFFAVSSWVCFPWQTIALLWSWPIFIMSISGSVEVLSVRLLGAERLSRQGIARLSTAVFLCTGYRHVRSSAESSPRMAIGWDCFSLLSADDLKCL